MTLPRTTRPWLLTHVTLVRRRDRRPAVSRDPTSELAVYIHHRDLYFVLINADARQAVLHPLKQLTMMEEDSIGAEDDGTHAAQKEEA